VTYEYRLIITNPGISNGITNFPPQILSSDWYQQVLLGVFPELNGSTTSRTVLRKLFNSVELLENFLVETKLNSPELLAVLAEWKTEYNITLSERIEELPEYTPTNPKIFD
jgi:hypothetical protein